MGYSSQWSWKWIDFIGQKLQRSSYPGDSASVLRLVSSVAPWHFLLNSFLAQIHCSKILSGCRKAHTILENTQLLYSTCASAGLVHENCLKDWTTKGICRWVLKFIWLTLPPNLIRNWFLCFQLFLGASEHSPPTHNLL